MIDVEAISLVEKGGVAGLVALVGFVGGIYFKAGKVVSELRGAKAEARELRGELHRFAEKMEGKMDSLAIVLSGVETRVSVLEAVMKLREEREDG